jgi:hypothetical protein
MNTAPAALHAADPHHYGADDVAPFPAATWHYSDPSTWVLPQHGPEQSYVMQQVPYGTDFYGCTFSRRLLEG